MRNECFDLGKECMKKKGKWKFLAIIFFMAFIAMTVKAIILKKRNKEYCDMIVDLSDVYETTREQEEELAEIRKRESQKKNSMTERKTVEERLEDNRVTEEE